MRYLFFMLSLVFIMAVSVPASAQIYEYRDADGNIRFTDDLGNVPEAQRENIKIIQGVSGYSATDWQDAAPDTDEPDGDADESLQTSADLVRLGESLRTEQAVLQEEYEAIEKEKSLLGDPPGDDATLEDLDAYEEKVDVINNRIIIYQKQLEDLENRVEVYNARFAR
jgi:flagellar motility protein MotE (MotC chaperone)